MTRDCTTCKHAKPWDQWLHKPLRCDKADKAGKLHDAGFWFHFGDCREGEEWENAN